MSQFELSPIFEIRIDQQLKSHRVGDDVPLGREIIDIHPSFPLIKTLKNSR